MLLLKQKKDNRIVVAIEKDNVIQQSLRLDEEVTSTPLGFDGIDLLKFSSGTEGRVWFYYEWQEVLDRGLIFYKISWRQLW